MLVKNLFKICVEIKRYVCTTVRWVCVRCVSFSRSTSGCPVGLVVAVTHINKVDDTTHRARAPGSARSRGPETPRRERRVALMSRRDKTNWHPNHHHRQPARPCLRSLGQARPCPDWPGRRHHLTVVVSTPRTTHSQHRQMWRSRSTPVSNR